MIIDLIIYLIFDLHKDIIRGYFKISNNIDSLTCKLFHSKKHKVEFGENLGTHVTFEKCNLCGRTHLLDQLSYRFQQGARDYLAEANKDINRSYK